MARWYIIHAYSGFENKVRESILSEAERKGLEALVEAVEVPAETVTEVKRGKKVSSERKLYPGYIYVEMDLNNDVLDDPKRRLVVPTKPRSRIGQAIVSLQETMEDLGDMVTPKARRHGAA